jgi:tetratricopeptide (TPR) repeat protein
MIVAAGFAAAVAGQHELAISLYTRAIALHSEGNPAAATAYTLRAGSYGHLGRLEDALQDKDRVVRMRTDDSLAHEGRALTLLRLNRYEDALHDYERCLRLNARYLPAHVGRAIALRHLSRLDEARAAYNNAIEIGRTAPHFTVAEPISRMRWETMSRR